MSFSLNKSSEYACVCVCILSHKSKSLHLIAEVNLVLCGCIHDSLRCLCPFNPEYPLKSLALLLIRDFPQFDLPLGLLLLFFLENGQEFVVVLLSYHLYSPDCLVAVHVNGRHHADGA